MTRDGWNLSYFSARLQQQPDSFELTGKGYWMHSFEALHFSTQVRYLRCSTGSSLYGGKVKATKKAKHKVKATIKTKCNIMSTTKTAAQLFATNSSARTAPAVELQTPYTKDLDLEFSTSIDTIDPTVTIT